MSAGTATAGSTAIRRLDGASARAAVEALSELLVDCVAGGASVSFMAPLAAEQARGFWRLVADGVASGERILLVAEGAGGRIDGTVQLIVAMPDNQPHRADLAKLLVHRRARRRGVAQALLAAAERSAREAGRTLLVLDTVTGGAAERLYAAAGWQRVGVIPGYALMPDGEPCATTYFYKILSPAEA